MAGDAGRNPRGAAFERDKNAGVLAEIGYGKHLGLRRANIDLGFKPYLLRPHHDLDGAIRRRKRQGQSSER